MFISRTPRNKQPSLSLSVLPTQGPASAGYKNPSVSRWGSIIVAKAHGLKDSYSTLSLFASLPALFIHQMCTRCSEETLHHLSCAGVSALLLKNHRSTKSRDHLSILMQIWRLSTTKSGKWKHFLQVTCQHLQLYSYKAARCTVCTYTQSNQSDYMSNIFHVMEDYGYFYGCHPAMTNCVTSLQETKRNSGICGCLVKTRQYLLPALTKEFYNSLERG